MIGKQICLTQKEIENCALNDNAPFKDTHAAEPQSLIRSLFVCIFSQELRFEET